MDPQDIETGESSLLIHDNTGFTTAFSFRDDACRELLRVTSEGEVILPDDLTLDEARDVLIQIAPLAAKLP